MVFNILIILSIAVFVLMICDISEAVRCDRRPFHTTFSATESNGRFRLSVTQAENDTYLPDQQYVVTLSSEGTDPHLFTAFMVWPESSGNDNLGYSRDVGIMRIHDKYPVKVSDRCPNTIEMVNAAPTDYVEMYWKSPVRDSGCVNLHAMVAENDEVWYQDGDGLILNLCEDKSYLYDIPMVISEHCNVCTDAKYELKFEGKWSRNTHPQKFPENEWSVYYGDMIGASHSLEYHMWRDGSSATTGMRNLALYNDTKDIQDEILSNYANGYIRTLIKGKGHSSLNGDMNNPTYALVRVDRERHLISTATALRPSPDWFLGVSDFELCLNNTWLEYISLELKPWDAGVNNGISFESPPELVNDLVSRVRVGSFDKESPFYNMNYKQVKPFATLTIRLIRTYRRRDCNEAGGEEDNDEKKYEATTTTVREEKSEEGSEPQEECPLSNWEEWTCTSTCGQGIKSRSRYHIVNGVEYRYQHGIDIDKNQEPSQYCITKYENEMYEVDFCEGPPCVTPPAPENSRRRRNLDDSADIKDCLMSSWFHWTDCNASCGPGHQLRFRSIIRHPRNGGQPCPTNNLEFRECISNPC